MAGDLTSAPASCATGSATGAASPLASPGATGLARDGATFRQVWKTESSVHGATFALGR